MAVVVFVFGWSCVLGLQVVALELQVVRLLCMAGVVHLPLSSCAAAGHIRGCMGKACNESCLELCLPVESWVDDGENRGG